MRPSFDLTPLGLALLGLALLGACPKEQTVSDTPAAKAEESVVSPPEGVTIEFAPTDAIWALAPADTRAAFVFGPGTGTHLLAGVTELDRSIRAHPDGETLRPGLADYADRMVKSVLDPARHTELGLDLARPGAVFFGAEWTDMLLVLPVAEPARFVRDLGGNRDPQTGIDRLDSFQCQSVGGYYACAGSAPRLASLGSSDGRLSKEVGTLPGHLRGHLEFYVSTEFLGGRLQSMLGTLLSGAEVLRGAMRLERGGFTADWWLSGAPAHPLLQEATRTESALAEQVLNRNPGGVLRVNLPFAQMLASLVSENADTIGIDVKTDIQDNITGELLLHTAAEDGVAVSVELGARDGRRLGKISEFVCELVPSLVPEAMRPHLSIDQQETACTVEMDIEKLYPSAAMWLPFEGPVTVSLAPSPAALILSVRARSSTGGSPVRAGKPGRELITGPWNISLWGYGSLASMFRPDAISTLTSATGGRSPGLMRASWWIFAHFTEFGVGFGVRPDGAHARLYLATQWSNPPALVRKFQDTVRRLLAGEATSLSELTELAGSATSSPLHRSVRAGVGIGPLSLVAFAGATAAIMGPAFAKYLQRSASSEAMSNMVAIFRGASAYANARGISSVKRPGALPASVGPTPELGTCCASGGTCAPDPALWRDPTWTALDFSIDEPFRYSYQFDVADDGRNVTIRAQGDLDCDGVYSTFELQGHIDDNGALSGSGEVRRIRMTE